MFKLEDCEIKEEGTLECPKVSNPIQCVNEDEFAEDDVQVGGSVNVQEAEQPDKDTFIV